MIENKAKDLEKLEVFMKRKMFCVALLLWLLAGCSFLFVGQRWKVRRDKALCLPRSFLKSDCRSIDFLLRSVAGVAIMAVIRKGRLDL